MKLLSTEICGYKVPLVYELDESLGLVSLRLVFKNAGKIACKIPGTAYLLSRILEEGAKGDADFCKKLEIKGIELLAQTGTESFSISLLCLKEHFAYALNMLNELLSAPKFELECFELVKTKTLGYISASKSNLDHQAKLMLNKLIFENHPFSFSKHGDEESLAKIELSDVVSFFKENLILENLFIVLGGNAKAQELKLDFVNRGEQKHFGNAYIQSDLYKELKMPSEQAYIYFAAPFYVADDKHYKAKVATFILGSSGFGSRLMEEIRVKRGLAYSAYAKNTFSLYKSGVFGYLQTKNENKDEAIKLVKKIFFDFTSQGIKKAELESAKNFLLGSEALAKETLFKRLDIAQHEYYMGYKLGHTDRDLESIKALSLKELNTFIAAHTEICSLSFAVIHG
ncbi:MAG: insulinase family protein [Campylobacter sp.]|uniref:M16 family metallopeptidase n=1 Tax=Campylobacter sp. TaxID=205 RepID=UPI002A837158|nr:pitrilysin family protein [Campylobacter sp.]MCI6339354.1 insulinase family protein [Campylobacter sp.]MCI7023221.1 insulinase family protein [Campylobacter sp.]MDY4445276.1 pitrilysin family protein [Campylobacter sp.]